MVEKDIARPRSRDPLTRALLATLWFKEYEVKEVFPIMFGVLFCSVFVWFFLCYRLFKILETRHPEKYESMGKPSLIMNNSISSNITFMKFLFRREWRELDDSGLATLGKSMLVFFAIYMVGFLTLFFSVPLGYAP